ncbi:hypothetical protein [Emticicia sp. BO119]|uniref:hypothetical protein n=1 Tax=Emticicia sp. BO119 TaxID=2757768 RepID=UPI0015F0B3C2|nr:hypothetical protein [Emticicia sp. BO119]MBA4850022.1 hypothetical protein [Emticicia sp. BO119]
MIKFISADDFINHQLPHLQQLMQRLRILILNAHPKMREHLEINTPMYKVKQDVCYFGKVSAIKGLEVCFLRGFQLSNVQGILDPKGRKFIYGITLIDLNDLKSKESVFLEILNEALILDEINEKSIFSEILQAGRKKKKS